MIYVIILIVLGAPGHRGEPGRTHIVHCRDNTDKVYFIISISNYLYWLNPYKICFKH